MSAPSPLLLLDDERKAQLDLLNKIDESGKNLFTEIRLYNLTLNIFQFN